jgi:hypothetical protein
MDNTSFVNMFKTVFWFSEQLKVIKSSWVTNRINLEQKSNILDTPCFCYYGMIWLVNISTLCGSTSNQRSTSIYLFSQRLSSSVSSFLHQDSIKSYLALPIILGSMVAPKGGTSTMCIIHSVYPVHHSLMEAEKVPQTSALYCHGWSQQESFITVLWFIWKVSYANITRWDN